MKGRPVLGAIAGLLLGLFVYLDLVFFKVIGSDSILFIALPVAGFLLGLLIGLWAPIGRNRAMAPVPPPAPPPPPAP